MKLDPPMVFVEYGGSTSVNCSTSSCNNVEGIGWEYSSGGTGLKEGVSTVELKIDEAKDWLTTPQCYVWADGIQKMKRLPITIYKMPKKVSMPKPRSPMYTTGGSELLQCDVEDVAPVDRLVISWYKENKMIFQRASEEKGKVPVNESLQPSIEVDAADDGAEVWCEAKLNLTGQSPAPMRSKFHVLTVFYPPTFANPENETHDIYVGTKISLNCSATGNPAPVYSWHFADPTQKWIHKHNEIEPILTLGFKASGVYSCTASNVAGRVTKYFYANRVQGNALFDNLLWCLVRLFPIDLISFNLI
uniref:Ig-like domain-containing protein n=1 Tax=Fundulus heteroclitus TaxID=8078 RepID=A0A3Q2NPF4_FUNHE